MSGASANVSRTRSDFQNKNANHDGSRSGLAQCTPMPLPALGSQRILQGNGTNVGTVISLLCPDKHKLVGENMKCVMDSNSTHWEGDTYCKPLPAALPYNDVNGFRLAVLVSIVSSAIILFMSMAFLTCCLVDCIENSKKKKLGRDARMQHWEEQDHQQEIHRPHDSNKSRNNNNNNNMEKDVTQRNQQDPLLGDSSQTCRCLQQYGYGVIGPSPLLPPLPGHEYNQPLLPPNPKSAQYSCQSQYNQPSGPTLSSNLIQVPATVVWQYGGAQQSSLPRATNQSNRRDINSAKEFSIRIISV